MLLIYRDVGGLRHPEPEETEVLLVPQIQVGPGGGDQLAGDLGALGRDRALLLKAADPTASVGSIAFATSAPADAIHSARVRP